MRPIFDFNDKRYNETWAHQDLNLGPIDYESTALTGLSYGPGYDTSHLYNKMIKK